MPSFARRLIGAALSLWSTSAQRRVFPLVAAASDLQFALAEVAARFPAPTEQVRVVFGSSGNFARQIEQGAPFEMFLSADEGFVFRLAEGGQTPRPGRALRRGPHRALRSARLAAASRRPSWTTSAPRSMTAGCAGSPSPTRSTRPTAARGAGAAHARRFGSGCSRTSCSARTSPRPRSSPSPARPGRHRRLLARAGPRHGRARRLPAPVPTHCTSRFASAWSCTRRAGPAAERFYAYRPGARGARGHASATASSSPANRRRPSWTGPPSASRSQLSLWTLLVLLPLAAWLGRVLAYRRFRGKGSSRRLVALPLVLPPTVLGFYLLVAFGAARPSARPGRAPSGNASSSPSRGCSSPPSSSTCPSPSSRCSAPSRRSPRERAGGRAVCGMPPWRALLAVELPLAWPGIVTAAVLTFAHTLGEFGVVLMVGGSIPGETQDDRDRDLRPGAGLRRRGAGLMSALLLAFSVAAIGSPTRSRGGSAAGLLMPAAASRSRCCRQHADPARRALRLRARASCSPSSAPRARQDHAPARGRRPVRNRGKVSLGRGGLVRHRPARLRPTSAGSASCSRTTPCFPTERHREREVRRRT